jgi:phage anti-repressor protein
MQDLIHIQQQSIGGEPIQTVNARDLHTFLEVGKDFSNWIKDRIQQFEFVENQDFRILANSGEYSGRGQPKKEYHLSLDMAKELAMIERTPKGKEARQYFIACERRLHAIVKTPQTHMVERLRQPNLLHGFPKGTTMTRLIREERQHGRR